MYFQHLTLVSIEKDTMEKRCTVLGSHGKLLAAEAAGSLCEERSGHGCPGPDTAGSGQLRLTPRRARLIPAATLGEPQGKIFKKE